MKSNYFIKNHPVSIFIYDFDGVLTDNRVLVSEDGKESVFCNRSDGLAIRKINDMGIKQLIISTEKNSIVSVRAEKLGITAIQGINNKKDILLEYCNKQLIDINEILYIGNDINDLEVMLIAGFPVCPKDAYSEIRKISRLIIPTCGGHGVIRSLLYYIK